MLRQEDHQFHPSLGNLLRPCLKIESRGVWLSVQVPGPMLSTRCENHVSAFSEGTSTRSLIIKDEPKYLCLGIYNHALAPLWLTCFCTARGNLYLSCCLYYPLAQPLLLASRELPTCELQCLPSKMEVTHASLGPWILTGIAMEAACSYPCPLCPLDPGLLLDLCFLTPECLTLPSVL